MLQAGGNLPKFEQNQVVRVIKTHESNGVNLTTGMLGTVYAGETYGALAANEVPVWFAWAPREFVGIDQDLLEIYEGDLDVLSAQALAYATAYHALNLLQQQYFTLAEYDTVERIKRVRQRHHVGALCDLMGWQESEAIQDFQKSEETLRTIAAVPYRIAKKQR